MFLLFLFSLSSFQFPLAPHFQCTVLFRLCGTVWGATPRTNVTLNAVFTVGDVHFLSLLVLFSLFSFQPPVQCTLSSRL